MRFALALTLVAGLFVAGAEGAMRLSFGSPPAGDYNLVHPGGNSSAFTAGFKLHGTSMSAIGITTDLIACTQPPAKKVQYPSAPDNWQPQKTIKGKRHGTSVSFAYSGAFNSRVGGYPQTMKFTATITAKGIVHGKVALSSDDVASTGESKCMTRGYLSFTGKRG